MKVIVYHMSPLFLAVPSSSFLILMYKQVPKYNINSIRCWVDAAGNNIWTKGFKVDKCWSVGYKSNIGIVIVCWYVHTMCVETTVGEWGRWGGGACLASKAQTQEVIPQSGEYCPYPHPTPSSPQCLWLNPLVKSFTSAPTDTWSLSPLSGIVVHPHTCSTPGLKRFMCSDTAHSLLHVLFHVCCDCLIDVQDRKQNDH